MSRQDTCPLDLLAKCACDPGLLSLGGPRPSVAHCHPGVQIGLLGVPIRIRIGVKFFALCGL